MRKERVNAAPAGDGEVRAVEGELAQEQITLLLDRRDERAVLADGTAGSLFEIDEGDALKKTQAAVAILKLLAGLPKPETEGGIDCSLLREKREQ